MVGPARSRRERRARGGVCVPAVDAARCRGVVWRSASGPWHLQPGPVGARLVPYVSVRCFSSASPGLWSGSGRARLRSPVSASARRFPRSRGDAARPDRCWLLRPARAARRWVGLLAFLVSFGAVAPLGRRHFILHTISITFLLRAQRRCADSGARHCTICVQRQAVSVCSQSCALSSCSLVFRSSRSVSVWTRSSSLRGHVDDLLVVELLVLLLVELILLFNLRLGGGHLLWGQERHEAVDVG